MPSLSNNPITKVITFLKLKSLDCVDVAANFISCDHLVINGETVNVDANTITDLQSRTQNLTATSTENTLSGITTVDDVVAETVSTTNNVSIGTSGKLMMGSTTGDRINLYSTTYGFGISSLSLNTYFPSNANARWWSGGNNNVGGTLAMTINDTAVTMSKPLATTDLTVEDIPVHGWYGGGSNVAGPTDNITPVPYTRCHCISFDGISSDGAWNPTLKTVTDGTPLLASVTGHTVRIGTGILSWSASDQIPLLQAGPINANASIYGFIDIIKYGQTEFLIRGRITAVENTAYQDIMINGYLVVPAGKNITNFVLITGNASEFDAGRWFVSSS